MFLTANSNLFIPLLLLDGLESENKNNIE